jgi:hypothetical protein
MVSEIHAFAAILLSHSNDYVYNQLYPASTNTNSKYKGTKYNSYSLYAANITSALDPRYNAPHYSAIRQ